jgi:hypothetical protein
MRQKGQYKIILINKQVLINTLNMFTGSKCERFNIETVFEGREEEIDQDQ